MPNAAPVFCPLRSDARMAQLRRMTKHETAQVDGVPSRTSVITGRYPYQIGVLRNSHRLPACSRPSATSLGGASYPESVQAPVGRGLAPVVADPEADHRRVVHAMLLEGQMARTGSSGSSMAGFGFRLRLVPHRVNVWQGLIHG